jgi:hypothetical protein
MRTTKAARSSPQTREFTADTVFTNIEAQDLAFDIQTQGLESLHKALEQKGRLSLPRFHKILAACEFVAAANGHPQAEASWCAMLENWLYRNDYVPAPATVALAVNRSKQALSGAARKLGLRVPVQLLKDLLFRLEKPQRTVRWQAAKGNRPAFRALARWLDASQGEVTNGPLFDRGGNARVVLTYLTVNASCKLINYPKVPRLELWLSNQNDRRELAASVKILLRGWQSTLERLEFDHVVDLTIRHSPPPFRTLTECHTQLADLPALKTFSTQNMQFDDRTLESVCRNRGLRVISVNNAQLSKKAIPILENCNWLEEVYISRCPHLPHADEAELRQRMPHASTVVIHDR